MQKVLTAEQMREVDRLTTEKYGIPSILLMENAAHAVARVITEKLGGSVKGKLILVLCGKGNNGGDGAALARILASRGANVDAFLFGKVEKTKGDAQTNFEILRRTTFEQTTKNGKDEQYRYHLLGFEEYESIRSWVEEYAREPDPHCVVDALFGSGLSGELGEEYRAIFDGKWFTPQLGGHDRHTLSVAIDLPSGLQSDNPGKIGPNSQVDVTVTFTAPKVANILPEASNFNGELTIADIGSPPLLVDYADSKLYLTESDDAAEFLGHARFASDSYKNKRGHALLVAGSTNYTGAAVLCGNAAIRSGVGLVTIATPQSSKESVASRVLPEVIVHPISENADREVGADAYTSNKALIGNADAIAVGCGLSATDAGVEKLVTEIVNTRKVPVIVDAGALWFCNPPDGLLQKPARSKGMDHPPLILTPHEGEFMRLLGTTDKDALKDRVAAVRDFAAKHDVILVLKGERVLIGEPGGKVVVNPTGNSGLGKAGNGDTLTGILAGFVAQAVRMNVDIFETVVAAVYVAGMAGDIAERKYGKRVMTASDVRECLVETFDSLSND